ncbi:peptide MFS transporter [Legionella sp. W05-934-2]|uniref:peptide MFS transporter n=1 Tax=Legionella sp. W05-934-2 TaxID=1198649 RepID=UPI0034624FA7
MSKSTTKHPRSLIIFCGTELWERYGFYAVQSLLALYLTQFFSWPDDRIYNLVGTFTALTYLSPVIGGWIADRLIGQKYAVIVGSIFLCGSYLLLSMSHDTHSLPISLACIAIGTGLIKPNISAMLGNEYDVDSPYRERGFTLFYMGITTGIILGTTLPSILTWYFNWSAAFISGAIGMVFALILFVVGCQIFKIRNRLQQPFELINGFYAFVLLALSGVIFWFILSTPTFAASTFAIIFLGSIAYLIQSIRTDSKHQAKLTMIICCLCCISILFWAFYFQMFTSLTLFIERVVMPDVFGVQFPPPYYVSIQSVGMLFFGLILTRNRRKLSVQEVAKRTNVKFFLAMICMSLAYLFITWVCYRSVMSIDKIQPLLIIPAYLLISIAELLLSPVGLAAITTLASKSHVSTMMGIFFVSLGLGGYLSGILATFTAVNYHPNSPLMIVKMHYLDSFNLLSFIMFIATVFSFIFFRLINKIILAMDSSEI